MKRLILSSLIVFITTWQPQVHAGLIVVVNKSNPVESLSSRQIMDIYMGRFTSYPNGDSVDTTDHPQDSQIRQDFYQNLVGKSVVQINAYWARLLFTGKAVPPKTKSSELDVIKYVQSNINAIAYLEEANLTQDLKVVYRFETIKQ